MDGVPRTRTSAESVALTFDDGPSEWTTAVIAALAGKGARATFFVTPGGAPDAIRRIADAGHDVGYHCREHVRHTERSCDEVRREVHEDLGWLDQRGIEPRAWRPPWGVLAPWSAGLAAEVGMELWLWSDDTRDWDGRGADVMLARLEASIEGGSVVLMHDGIGPGALRDDALSTIELIGPLVDLCRARGLEPGPLSALELAGA